MTTWLQALITALLLSAAPWTAAQVIPSRDASGITDMTSTFTPDQRQSLSTQLQQVQHRTGAEVLVLSVNSLQGEAPEAFSQRIFELWKPGAPKRQDGIIIVLAHRERTLRLHVGPGLAQAVPSSLAKEITSTVMSPRLKRGDFYLALLEGVQALEGHIRVHQARSGQVPEPVTVAQAAQGGSPLALRMDTELSTPRQAVAAETALPTETKAPAGVYLSPTLLASLATALILCVAAGLAVWQRQRRSAVVPVQNTPAA